MRIRDFTSLSLRKSKDKGNTQVSVSVVIPAYRAASTLKRTVASCLPSTDPHNIIVVLDGPDPELETVARSCAKGIRVVVLPMQSGAPACRNIGLEMTETDQVIFLDADDYVEGDFLISAARVIEQQDADLVLGRFSFEMPDGARQTHDPRDRYGVLDSGTILKRWLVDDYTPPCAVVWRTAFVSKLQGWDEAIAKNQDGDIIYRALMAGAVVAPCADGQGIYVQDDNPERITRRQTRRTLNSQFTVLEKIRTQLDRLPFDPSHELSLAYYNLARLAYTHGAEDIGYDAELEARKLGLEGQPGTMAHTTVSSVLGLRAKQRLASFARRLVSL